MTEMMVLEIIKQAMIVGLQVAGPLLLVSLVVGTVLGIMMAATQVQEFTLTFVPKILGMGLVLLLAGPFMLHTLMAFARFVFARLSQAAPW
jgi:flagellar biosynthetic protein FliQ